MEQLRTGSAVQLNLLFVVPITSQSVEAQAHKLLKAYRRLGEWFATDRLEYYKVG